MSYYSELVFLLVVGIVSIGAVVGFVAFIHWVNVERDVRAMDLWQARQRALYEERDAEFERRNRDRDAEFNRKREEANDEFERTRIQIATTAVQMRSKMESSVPEAPSEPTEAIFKAHDQIEHDTSINLPLENDLESMGVYLSEEESYVA